VFGGAFGVNAFIGVKLGGDGGKYALPAGGGHGLTPKVKG